MTPAILRNSKLLCYCNRKRAVSSLNEFSYYVTSRYFNGDSAPSQFSDSPPPDPIPNRPLRSHNRRPSSPSSSSPTSYSSSSKPRTPPPVQPRPQENTDFLERFKLGFSDSDRGKTDNQEKNNVQVGNAAEVSQPPPPQDADEIFNKMKETGLIPNAVAMLDGLCKDGLVQEAMKLFGLMREKGTMPEVIIYSAVVEGFIKAHKFDDSIRIFRKMQSNGIVPNAFSYNVLVQGLCKGKRLDEGFDFCLEMLESGHSPNLATFTSLIDGFVREKGSEEAQRVVGGLKQKGLYFDDKAVREYLDKKGPFLPAVWEAILGKRPASKRSPY